MLHHARISRIASHFYALSELSTFSTLSQCSQTPYKELLSLCPTTNSLFQTKHAHATAVVHGLLPISISISAALILRYATFSSDPTIVRSLFNQSVPFSCSAFLHDTLVRAQTIMGVLEDSGFGIYNGMLRSGVLPDDHTSPFVIKLCSDFMEVRKRLEAHGLLIKSGFDYDVFVNNTLMVF